MGGEDIWIDSFGVEESDDGIHKSQFGSAVEDGLASFVSRDVDIEASFPHFINVFHDFFCVGTMSPDRCDEAFNNRFGFPDVNED